MKELNKTEMLKIQGGSILNNTLISTLIRGAQTFFEIGKAFGSSIRRIFSSCMC